MANELYRYTVSGDYIYHYGIKGMKWGIRRTAEELGHKIKSKFSRKKKTSSDESGGSSGSSKIKGSVTVKGTKKNPSTTRTSDGSSTEERKKKVLESRSAKELYENADLFTTKELQDAYNRLVLEKNIKNLTPKQVSKGQQMIDKYVNTAETIAKVLNSTNKVASQLNRFKNILNTGKKDTSKKTSSDKKDNNSNNDKKDDNSNNTKTKNESSNSSKNETNTSTRDDAVEADSYEIPKNRRNRNTSARDTARAARDFVYDVQDTYESYTNSRDGRVQDGMDFAFELGDRVFNSNIYGLLGSGDDDKKKR